MFLLPATLRLKLTIKRLTRSPSATVKWCLKNVLSGKRLSGNSFVRESSVRETSCPGNVCPGKWLSGKRPHTIQFYKNQLVSRNQSQTSSHHTTPHSKAGTSDSRRLAQFADDWCVHGAHSEICQRRAPLSVAPAHSSVCRPDHCELHHPWHTQSVITTTTHMYLTLYGHIKSAKQWPIIQQYGDWYTVSGLLYLVQRGGAWPGYGSAQAPPRCTKCNSPPINGQCTNFILFDVPLDSKGLNSCLQITQLSDQKISVNASINKFTDSC